MKAVVFHEFGGLDTLQLEDLPDPRPGPGEVLIDIGATASSRSATTRSASEASALASLRSSPPGANRRERAVERSRAVARVCQTFGGLSTRVA